MPHGFCIQWTPIILWSYVIADGLIALAYFAIPLALAYVAWRRNDLRFRLIYLMFCAFIVACGTTHLFSIVMLWYPYYWLDAILKIMTAALSIATSVYLIKCIPFALRQHSQEELEYQLLTRLIQVRTTELDRLSKRFYSTFESAPVGIVNMSLQGLSLEANQGFCNFVGYNKQELSLLTFEQLMHSEHHDMVASKIAECLADKISEFTLENKYLHKDGTIVWGNTSLKLIRHDDDTLNYFVLIVADISLVKAAKNDLKDLETLNFILNNTPVLMGFWDKHLKNRFSNAAYSRWFNKTPQQIKGKSIRQTIGEQLYAENLPHINAVMHGESQHFERHIPSPNSNETIHTQLSYLPHIINRQVEGFYVLGVDITDKEQLRETWFQNRAIFESLNQGVIITDTNRKITYTNQATRQLTGYSAEDMLGQSCHLLEGKNTDPQQILKIRETLTQKKSYRGEIINYRKDGSEFWNELVISPIFDSRGNLAQFVGFQNDITERKQLQAALLASEQSFKNLADAAPVMIWQAGIDKLCFWFNKTWLEFGGRSLEKEYGIGWTTYVHPDDIERCMDIYSRHFDQQLPFRMECRLLRHDGEYRWLDYNGAPRFDAQGLLTGYIGSCIDITAIHEAQATIIGNQKLINNLLKHIPGMVYQYKVTPDGHHSLPFASAGINDIFEVPPEQVCDDTSTLTLNVMHNDEIERLNASIMLSASTLQPWELEFEVNLPSKGQRWLSGHSQPERLADGSTLWYGYMYDITERKSSEREREFLMDIINETHDLVSTANRQGQITYMNRAGFKMLGFPENTNISSLKIGAFHPERITRMIFDEALPTASQEGFWVGESYLLHRDGHEIPVSQLIQGHHRDNQNTHLFFSTIMRDMTETKRTEAELIEAKTRAENLAQAKTDFLANMSHEIRTPMNAILGFSQLALCKDFPPEALNYLHKINTASTNLLGILNDILEVSKLEAGGIHINPVPFDLTDLLNMLSTLFGDLASEKSINLGLIIAPDVPHYVIGDKPRIGQILINLLGNAVKFTDNGSVDLHITLKHIEPEQAQLLFCVTDTGLGLAAKDLGKLFKPFSQLDESITRRYGGTGLGLVLCDRLAKLMGSEITVVSTLGVGSRFSFELQLPLASESTSSKPNDALVTTMYSDSGQFAGIHILVAEDNIFNQQVIREFLNLSGISVEIVNHGEEALTALEALTFDMVLMDIHMPVMDGFEASWLIRSQPRFARLPIIAMTAGVTQEEQENCIAAGMNDFISKPLNPPKLLSTIAQWLKPQGNTVTEDDIIKTLDIVPEQSAQTVFTNDTTVSEFPAPLQDLASHKIEPDTSLDPNILIDLIGDDPTIVAEFLDYFHESSLKTNAEIIAAVSACKTLEASYASHKLKSAAGCVGANRLAELCAQLEEAGKADDEATLIKLLPECEKEWAVVEKQLLAWPTKVQQD